MMLKSTVSGYRIERLSPSGFEGLFGAIIINTRITCRPRGDEGTRV